MPPCCHAALPRKAEGQQTTAPVRRHPGTPRERALKRCRQCRTHSRARCGTTAARAAAVHLGESRSDNQQQCRCRRDSRRSCSACTAGHMDRTEPCQRTGCSRTHTPSCDWLTTVQARAMKGTPQGSSSGTTARVAHEPMGRWHPPRGHACGYLGPGADPAAPPPRD